MLALPFQHELLDSSPESKSQLSFSVTLEGGVAHFGVAFRSQVLMILNSIF